MSSLVGLLSLEMSPERPQWTYKVPLTTKLPQPPLELDSKRQLYLLDALDSLVPSVLL